MVLKTFKVFFACKIVFDANHHYPENIQKFFSPAKLSWQQIIIMLKVFKDFVACKDVFAANLQNPKNIQRLFCLQICLRRKSSLSWNYSNIFSPAKLSSTQITIILKIFKDVFACNIVLDLNHHYPGNIQRLFRLQVCLSRKSSLSWKYSKIFRQQNCLRRKSSLSWNYSKVFSPAKLS